MVIVGPTTPTIRRPTTATSTLRPATDQLAERYTRSHATDERVHPSPATSRSRGGEERGGRGVAGDAESERAAGDPGVGAEGEPAMAMSRPLMWPPAFGPDGRRRSRPLGAHGLSEAVGAAQRADVEPDDPAPGGPRTVQPRGTAIGPSRPRRASRRVPWRAERSRSCPSPGSATAGSPVDQDDGGGLGLICVSRSEHGPP